MKRNCEIAKKKKKNILGAKKAEEMSIYILNG